MQYAVSIPRNLLWLCLIFSVLVSSSVSDPRVTEAHFVCGKEKEPARGYLTQNFLNVMEVINEKISDGYLLGSSHIRTPPPPLYSLAQCHGDLPRADCFRCFSESRTKLSGCLPANSGRIYLDGCFLRYDNYDFYWENIDPKYDLVNCSSSPTVPTLDPSMNKELQSKIDQVLVNVSQKALRNQGYGVAEAKGGAVVVYALAQCWQTLNETQCRDCLVSARSKLRMCGPITEGKSLFTGCFMRYSTEEFFNHGPEDTDDPAAERIAAFVLGAMAVTALTSFGAFMGYKRISKKRDGLSFSICGSTRGGKYSLNFKYETLEKATDSFNDFMKLGQGGAGSVFKGTLPNGKTIAVKRLFFNTSQWVDQFFNEVNLISGIQHKNLIRLLGCSIEGPESLLVYEYVPNRSLDQILFVKNTIHILSWQQRFNIITGTAEGLAYLHGGSGVKIIHRDIKSSNILLDENLTPKIADFGLARCVGPDNSHISTGIAGTLGYMAPEYLVKGQLTEKADVYAFGVVVLEIATGRKNSVFSEGSNSILYTVWKHYKANMITRSIDPGLSSRFSEEEASRVLQIGLLCTQAAVGLRPSMSEVVQMLSENDRIVPSPRQPPFLNASVLSPDDSRSSTFIKTADLNEQRTAEESWKHP